MAVRAATGAKIDWSADGTAYINIPEVRTWGITPAPEVKTYASSTTAGAKRRLAGNDDFTGTITVYVDETDRIDAHFTAGDVAWFKLYEDTDDFFIAPAFVDSVAYTDDIEGGELIAATISFSSNGALIYPT